MKTAPIARFNREALSPERLKAIASTPAGRLMLQQQRLQLRETRDQIAATLRAQLAESDEALARIDVALDGGLKV